MSTEVQLYFSRTRWLLWKHLLSGTNASKMLRTCSLCGIQSLIIGFFSVHQCKFELDAELEFETVTGSKNSTQQTKCVGFLWILFLLHWTQNHIIILYPVCQIQKLNVKAERCTADLTPVNTCVFQNRSVCGSCVTRIRQSVMCIHHASRLFLSHPMFW